MEKREHARKEIFARISVQLNEYKTVRAVMYNISQGGINFRINEQLVEGDYCKIGIGNDNNMYWLDGNVKVIQKMDGREDVIKSGVKFSQEIADHEFDALVSLLHSIGFN